MGWVCVNGRMAFKRAIVPTGPHTCTLSVPAFASVSSTPGSPATAVGDRLESKMPSRDLWILRWCSDACDCKRQEFKRV